MRDISTGRLVPVATTIPKKSVETTMTTNTLSSVNVIDAGQLRQLQHESPDLRILDVRTGGEFQTAHIPGSYNVPLDTLGEHVRDFANVDHPVVLVCQTGGRAIQAHNKLTEAGKHTLRILEGGLAAWQTAGGDITRGEAERWAMDRQVRLAAGTMVLAGIAASTVIPGAKWFAGAIGSGLTFSAVSNTCAMGTALSKLPYNRTEDCDVQGVLAQLNNKGI